MWTGLICDRILSMDCYRDKTIYADSVDDLVSKGVKYIRRYGVKVWTTSGPALQTNNVTYVLKDSRNRVHTLRSSGSIKYLARELFAYMVGSLRAGDGLAEASKFWNKIADENGMINSNYGFYVFYQKTPSGKTQLQWVRENIIGNQDTRQAVININSIEHKVPTKDFPCTLGLVFHLDDEVLNLDVSSRSTDVITGLPYDIGFFSFVLELLAGLLSVDLSKTIRVGYTAMHAIFTQIYDKTESKIPKILAGEAIMGKQKMPIIDDAEKTLDDIYKIRVRKPRTDVIEWVMNNKE